MSVAAPTDEAIAAAELAANLDDPVWRLSHLYWIIVKDEDADDGDTGLVLKFVPNRAQRRLLRKLHNRSLILKARQLGYTTLIALLWLDTALFAKAPIHCGIIAHEREAAEGIFRDKVLFAYERLPAELRAAMPLASKNKTELVFAHNQASIKVAVSVRSSTLHRLHISEFGKIARKYPDKAREIMAGSIPTVPTSGMIVVESTAEGQDGYFYDMVQRALGLLESRTPLSKKDYRLTFAPWWDAPEYTMDPESVLVTEVQHAYFNDLELVIGRPISEGQRAWYVSTLLNDFAGEQPLMWQEYPSTPKEAFAVSTEGCYYATQMAAARRANRIRPELPIEKGVPVYSFWDIGRGDMTAIWLMQPIGPEYRFIWYYEETGEEMDHYAAQLQKRGLIYGGHYLPHEAGHKRMGEHADTNKSLKEMLEGLMPGQPVHVVPRVTNIMSGIQSARAALASCWFDESACQAGIARLQNYRKEWDKARGRWREQVPMHNDDSHGADAYRQFAQVHAAGERFAGVSYKMGAPQAARRAFTSGRRRGGGAMAA